MSIDKFNKSLEKGKNFRVKKTTVNQHFTESVNELKDLREDNDGGEEDITGSSGNKLTPTIWKVGKLEQVSKNFEDKMTKGQKDGLGAKSEFYKEESSTLSKISKDFTKDMNQFSNETITEKFKPKFLMNDLVRLLASNNASKFMKNEANNTLSLNADVKVEESRRFMKLGAFYRNWTRRPTVNRHISQIITIEQKIRKKTQRIIHTDPKKSLVTAREVRKEDLAQAEEETTHKIQNMQSVLKKHVGKKFNLFSICLNPNSYAESVENLFHISFLVKPGFLQMFEGEDGWPYVTLLDSSVMNENKNKKKSLTHITVSINIITYKELVKFLNIKESFF
ncbi:hypothetical protein QEN19_000669 [Hanseniaspora menglaensis]